MLLVDFMLVVGMAVSAMATDFKSGGGAQGYIEQIKEHHLSHGAPAHPLHKDRPTVVKDEIGSAHYAVSNAPTTPFTHFFENSVGSGHMSLTLREDWRTHLRMAAQDLGVKHIRGHGLLDDDMSVSYSYGKHAFYNIDSLVDLLMSVGMRPIFELSFMPAWLANGTDTVCHYQGHSDPPKNYSQWGELIGALGSHLVTKYGDEVAAEFFFEVWNEPNDHFWGGDQQGYFDLYTHAAQALKKASPNLKVGGPATCCADCWVEDFVHYMDNHSIPYDFISTHAYSSCQMAHLGDVPYVVEQIANARSDLNNVTSSNDTNHPNGKTPPWLITEFGASCNQGFGNPGSPQFPSAIHDMIDQSSYTIAAVASLAGEGEPQALSYWAISDVFEESFFPVHNESFHGMFGLVNLHGIPKPSYRAYQLLHETGGLRLPVAGPSTPPPTPPSGQCTNVVKGMDVWGGDVAPPVDPCPTCGLFSMDDCCTLCLEVPNRACDTAVLWTKGPNATLGYRCGLKSFNSSVNTTADEYRDYTRVHRQPVPPPTNNDLCLANTGVLAVTNGTTLDIIIYNHASFSDPIVACNITISIPAALLNLATVRRIDEDHANPLATWIEMGAPDYTTSAQNEQLLKSSQLQTERLPDIATVQSDSFSIVIPPHGVAAVRTSSK